MEQEKLNGILQAHKKWLDSNGEEGARADLRGDNLRYADLRYADLRDANLRYADLRHVDLRHVDLSGTDLSDTDLRGADLRDADLCDADMDYAALPLWCGGLHMHVDDRIGIQLLYHAVANILFSKNTSSELKKSVSNPDMIAVVNKFHRVDGCGKVEPYCEVKPNEKP